MADSITENDKLQVNSDIKSKLVIENPKWSSLMNERIKQKQGKWTDVSKGDASTRFTRSKIQQL